MATITLPQAVPDMLSGTVSRWLKQVGDAVRKGEAIAEVEIEQAFIRIEAGADATLAKIYAPVGTTVEVGGALGELAPSGQAVSQPAVSKGEKPAAVAEPSGNVVPILMPQAGNSMEEGTILEWKVAEGETITEGQIICEIETDKATMEYESPHGGRLARIVVGKDETVAVKAPIALLAESDAEADAYLATLGGELPTIAPAPASEPTATTSRSRPVASAVTAGGRVKASPYAKKLAAERGVELAAVAGGSGPGGRIVAADVVAAKAGGAPAAVSPAGADGVVRRTMSKMRRAIAMNLQASKQTIPHFYLRMTFKADALFNFYRKHKPATGCTVNDVMVLAVAKAMAEMPVVRSQIDGSEIVEYPHANIGIAVGVDDGLVVPVLMGADQMSLAELPAMTKRIVEDARRGKVDNMGRGNFTITNLGMFGVEEFAAIINPPEAAILAVSALREDVIVEDGTMKPARVMTLTLSTDHRIIDGVVGAQFLARLKELLEAPEQLA